MISSLLKPTVIVNEKKYKIMKQIGEGGFAFVYNVMSTGKGDSGERYALKKMICQTDEQLDEAKKEIDTMIKIKHTNVLPLIEFAYVLNKKGQKEVLLVLPLYHGSVQTQIDHGPGYPHCAFTDGLDVLKIMRQIVEGLSAIHASGLRHADLKPANILINECFQAVITDFGSVSSAPITVKSRAEALEVQEKAASFTTASFRAPELYNTPSSCEVGFASDVWSLGCLFYCMLYSRSPFESAVEGLSTLSIMSAQYQIPESNLWPEEYITMLSGCMTVDPDRRSPLPEVKSTLHCIPCPPLDLSVNMTSPPTPPLPLTQKQQQSTSPPAPLSISTATASAAGFGSGGGGMGSSTSTTSSAVSTGQIAFSNSTTPFSERGVESFPTTPVVTACSCDASGADITNFAEFPNHSAAYDTSVSATIEADSTLAAHLRKPEGGDTDEFASCGSALSGLVFDDHNMEGSVFNCNSSNADSYVIPDHDDAMSNLSTGNNSPLAHGHHHNNGAQKTSTPRSHASFEGYELTEVQLRKAQYAQNAATNATVGIAVSALPSSAASAGGASVRASAGTDQHFSTTATNPTASGSDSSDMVHVRMQDEGDEEVVTLNNDKNNMNDTAGSEQFDSDEEFGEFTTGTGVETGDQYGNSPSPIAPLSGSELLSSSKLAAAGATEQQQHRHQHQYNDNGKQPQRSKDVNTLEAVDLWKVIADQSQQGKNSNSVLKEGPVYMMRQSGFPKRWMKKQVYLVLTPLGVILRKDSQSDARIHEMISLHRPAHLTPTDTLSIGLNGLLVQGSCPVPQSNSSPGSHSPVPNTTQAAWVEVSLLGSNSESAIERKTQTEKVKETEKVVTREPRKAQLVPAKFEISFDSKDIMNDWIDAIMDARDALL